MTEQQIPDLPPLLSGIAVPAGQDPLAAACASAEADGDPGELYYATDEGRMRCAIVLAPDRPKAETLQMVHVSMLALGDALGARLPAIVGVMFGWPDRIYLNGGLVGGLQVRIGPDGEDGMPDWMVVGAEIDIAGPGEDALVEPGTRIERTSLVEEGCVEVRAIDLVESFGRHFLLWFQRYRADGFEAIMGNWEPRAYQYREETKIVIAGETFEGKLAGLNPAGGVVLEQKGGARILPLSMVLDGPSWDLS